MSDTTPPNRTTGPETPAQPGRGGHTRRPPLAEIDTWELWQEWKRGHRSVAMPWVGLLVSFCMVLAGMYSFFFFSTSSTGDTIAQVVLTIILVVFTFTLWRKISARRDFALIVVTLILVVSGLAFLLWLGFYRFSEWNPLVAIGGTLVLGLLGIAIGLPSLNAIGRRQEEQDKARAAAREG